MVVQHLLGCRVASEGLWKTGHGRRCGIAGRGRAFPATAVGLLSCGFAQYLPGNNRSSILIKKAATMAQRKKRRTVRKGKSTALP
jgi:hypothetical protein